MLIGLVGPRCSGKRTVADFLVTRHHFTPLAVQGSDNTIRSFNDSAALLNFVTENWRSDFVTWDIDLAQVDQFKKRPFFLLVYVEAPVTVRYQRLCARDTTPLTLESFVAKDDEDLFGVSMATANNAPPTRPSLCRARSTADLTITNSYTTHEALHSSIADLQLPNLERLRPSWDTYFMHLSDLAARRSNCMKRRVGCILVKDSRVLATGYNGTPRGLRNCNEGGCDRCNANAACGIGLDRCLCMHAEENALLEAGRGRVDVAGTVLYCNTCPCLGCAIKIIQVGIKEVVYSKSYGMDEMTAKVFKEAGVHLRQHSPPSMRLDTDSLVDEVTVHQLGWLSPPQ